MGKQLAKTYDPGEMEDRIYQNWLNKKYFHAEVNPDKKPFTIIMPPPNITGQLHMGHALDQTLQDVLTRFRRLQGYSALWLSVLYLVGAAVRKHDLFSRVPRRSGLVCYLVTTCLGAVLTALGYYRAEIPIEPLSNYISPLVIIQALSLLIFLRGMKLPKIACKVIGFFSPHSFSIYIIHTQDAVWTIWLTGRYAERTQTTFTAMLPVMFVFYTLSLYGLCLIADMPLHYGIKLFRGAVGRLRARKTDAS